MKASVRGPALVADIGGTHARFALADGDNLFGEATLPVAGFAGPAEAARDYLARAGGPVLKAAVFALAAPIDGECVRLTNAGWTFARAALAAALGLPPLRLGLINDFHALALSLPALSAGELQTVGGGTATPGAPRVVLGPGTGLGVAAWIPGAGGGLAVPGEGGHQTLAPGDERESQILARARREFDHVSAERLLSGSGLPLLHRLRAEVDGQSGETLTAPAIVAGAIAGDAACRATIDCFCAWLGSVAGNLALCFGAGGGVYIGGGIVPRLGPLFAASAFRARFEAKGRFTGYLAAVPTHVILADTPALRGAAAFAATLDTAAVT